MPSDPKFDEFLREYEFAFIKNQYATVRQSVKAEDDLTATRAALVAYHEATMRQPDTIAIPMALARAYKSAMDGQCETYYAAVYGTRDAILAAVVSALKEIDNAD